MSIEMYISSIENKISKNIGILYKARLLLNKPCIKQLYFSYIHSYLNYGNIAWASTNKGKLKVLLRRQKHAARLINFKNKFIHAKPLLVDMKALNIYQLNIYQILLFMHKVKNQQVPKVFTTSFKIYRNKYNTKSTSITFSKPFCRTKTSQFSIMFRGPHIWNSLISNELLNLPYNTFKNKVKKLCLNLNNEENLFL